MMHGDTICMMIVIGNIINVFFFAIAFFCSEKDGESSDNVNSNLTVYKNQTGYSNVDALQT